ncbi:hypothetical protein [Desulforamulus ruminis]|uniref:Uncharacterized protein n=2 Tax=Desulforamulus ruminis TaxID=1564 RepID=F6DRK1_DESRL|nr:hypothetical protein [Desulforamulus ruminis]AEG58755.1 hypothetical protein Desru_0469 [Desulforamulus ruminis DSM 2154]
MGYNYKVKRAPALFFYTLLLGYLLIKGTQYKRGLEQDYEFLSALFFSVLFPVFMGVCFALPNLLDNLQRPGKWRIDWVILFSVGLPALYATTAPLLYFTPLGYLIPRTVILTLSQATPRAICGVALGYIMVTLLEKKNSAESMPKGTDAESKYWTGKE